MQALDHCLAPLSASAWPQVAWRSSGLTSRRDPVEFGFSNHDDRLRVTLEVAPLETPEAERLDAALALAEAIGAPRPEAGELAEWRALQADHRLAWGCWLGLRQTRDGFGVKLYVEAPPDAPIVRADWRAPGARLKMIGFDLTAGVQETYFAWPRVIAEEAVARWRALGLKHTDPIVATAAALTGLPATRAMALTDWGLSLAQAEPRLAIFLNAHAQRGGQAAARRCLLTRPCPSYSALLGDRPDSALPDHGVVTLIPRADGVELRVGVAACDLV